MSFFGSLAFCRLTAAVLIGAALAAAASTQTWEISDFKDFAGGKFKNLSLDPEGRLVLAPKLEKIFESEQPVIWAAAAADDGAVFLGTGHQGNLYRLTPEGEGKLLWTAPEIEIFALAAAPGGAVFVGTSPQGKVYRVSRDGAAEEWFNPEQTYIWSLALAPSGNLYVGTGDGGKIYEVSAKNKGEIYFDSEQRHVISLTLDPASRLLAGTDPNGILYRIDAKDKAFALYDSDLPEIRAVRVGPEGDIFAAAMGGGVTQATQAISAASAAAATTISVTATSGGDSGIPGLDSPGASSKPGQSPSVASSLSTPIISYGLETANLLRIRPGRSVEKLWSSTEANILAIETGAASTQGVLAATDQTGRVYRIDLERRRGLLTQTDQDQITQLLMTPKGLLLTTAHSGAVYRLSSAGGEEGEFETAPRDSGGVSQWGRLSSTAALPANSSIEFRTRSGNSARPDKTWSEWSEPIRAPEGGAVSSPPARFLQWKAVLRGADPGPVLEKVRVNYLPQNSPPAIDSISVSSEQASGDDSSSSSSSSSSAASSAAYSITVTASGDSGGGSATSTDSTNVGGNGSKKLVLNWQANDPDGDKLEADLSFRGEGETAWKSLKEGVEESTYKVDSDALADGAYRFRVSVSDRRANPPASALRTERISEPVLVDHTPPAVKLLETSGRRQVKFEASDQASALVRAEYSIDAGDWVPLFSEDGIIDSPSEQFTIELDGLAPGEHLLTLRVHDRAGNRGLAKAVIR